MDDLLKNIPEHQRQELADGQIRGLVGWASEMQTRLQAGELKKELVDNLATHSFLNPYEGLKKIVSDVTSNLKRYALARFFEEMKAVNFTKFAIKEDDYIISIWMVMTDDQYEVSRHDYYDAQQRVNAENREGGVKINLYIDKEEEHTFLPYGFEEVIFETKREKDASVEQPI